MHVRVTGDRNELRLNTKSISVCSSSGHLFVLS